jgi:lysyl-tRNA synthetase class I
MKSNNYNIYKSSNIYKNEINELIKKLVKRRESEDKPKTLLKRVNCYNQYVQLTKPHNSNRSKSKNMTNSIQRNISREQKELSELCTMLTQCNSTEAYSGTTSSIIENILKTLKTYVMLDEVMKNQLIVKGVMIMINKYVFRTPKYRSKIF